MLRQRPRLLPWVAVASCLLPWRHANPPGRLVDLQLPAPPSLSRRRLRATPPLSTAPVGMDWALCSLECSRSDGPAHSRPLRPWSSACPGQISNRRRPVGAPGRPCAAAGAMFPLPPAQAGEKAHRAAVLWNGPNFGWTTIYPPMGVQFLAWRSRCRDLYRRGGCLIRCPFSAGHGLALAGDGGWPHLPGKPRLKSADAAPPTGSAPKQSDSAACCWPSVASANRSQSRTVWTLARLVVHQLRSSGCKPQTEWPGFLTRRRAARWR